MEPSRVHAGVERWYVLDSRSIIEIRCGDGPFRGVLFVPDGFDHVDGAKIANLVDRFAYTCSLGVVGSCAHSAQPPS
jgi:hypothetical protein